MAAFAGGICPVLTARDALVLIEQIAIGLDLFRGALEEPGKGSKVASKRRSMGGIVLRQNMTRRRREHHSPQLKIRELAWLGQRLRRVGQLLAGRAPGQELIDLLDPVDQSFHWCLVRIQKNVVLEPAEAELKSVPFARLQAESSFGYCFKHGKDATTGRAGDALAV